MKACTKCPREIEHVHATAEDIQDARDLHGSDEIEIDEGALLSIADGGVWVSAWVWVPREGDNDDQD